MEGVWCKEGDTITVPVVNFLFVIMRHAALSAPSSTITSVVFVSSAHLPSLSLVAKCRASSNERLLNVRL